MKRRILSFVLALILCAGLSIPASALNWDTNAQTGDSLFVPSEEEWRDNISISNIVDSGAYDPQDGDGIAHLVYYCDEPARVEVLKNADVSLGGSMAKVIITQDGKPFHGESVSPTYKNAVEDPDFGAINGAGTYWDLQEGVYFMWSVNRSEQIYIVVGDPDNAYSIQGSDGQTFYLSQAILGEYNYTANAGTLDVCEYYVLPDMTITLPQDAEESYEMLAVINVYGMGETVESYYTLQPGDTVSFEELRYDENGNEYGKDFSVRLYNEAGDEVLAFRVLLKQESFTDVVKGMYYYNPVSWAIAEGVTDGTSDTAFSPNMDCRQAHILTFLWRAAGEPEPGIGNPFSNSAVTEGLYFYKAFLWAYEKGVMTNADLDPNAGCSRSDVVTYLWRLSGSPNEGTSVFEDIPATAEYAKAVSWAVENGITDGTGDTTFSPEKICTRGQIVTFLHRYFV